jgi:hypothetical protein
LKKPGDPPGNWTWYFIQLPSPAGATSVSIQAGASQVWSNDANVTGPFFTQDSQWTYVGFRLPDPSSQASADGEITLHYVVPTATAAPPRIIARIPIFRPMPERGDDWEQFRKRMRNPADLRNLDETLRATQLATKLRPHTVRLAVAAPVSIPPHQPIVGPGHRGAFIRAKVVADPEDAASRKQLDQNLRRVVPKEILPTKRNF